MKTKLLIPAMLLSSAAYAATPGVDIDRVGRDVTIMKQIIATAFKDADLCRDCGDTITARYLTEQGVVFTIRPSSTFLRLGLRTSDDNDDDLTFQIDSLADIADIPDVPEVPAIVGDALSHINIDVTDDGRYVTLGSNSYVDRATRQKLRDVERDRRRAEEKLRDVEIEMIHAEDERRAALPNQADELRQQLDKLRGESEQLDATLEEKREAWEEQRDARRKALEAKRTERLAKVESVLFEAVCDYGSTMKNIPGDEKLSLIVETGPRYRSNARSHVYVLSRKDVNSCGQGEWQKLADKAIAYEF